MRLDVHAYASALPPQTSRHAYAPAVKGGRGAQKPAHYEVLVEHEVLEEQAQDHEEDQEQDQEEDQEQDHEEDQEHAPDEVHAQDSQGDVVPAEG